VGHVAPVVSHSIVVWWRHQVSLSVTISLSFTEADCGGNTTAIRLALLSTPLRLHLGWSPVSVFLIC